MTNIRVNNSVLTFEYNSLFNQYGLHSFCVSSMAIIVHGFYNNYADLCLHNVDTLLTCASCDVAIFGCLLVLVIYKLIATLII